MPTQDHHLRMGSGGEGFVAAYSLAAVEVGVHARVKFVHHVALMGAGSVWCRSSVGAMGAVAGSARPVGSGRTGRVRSAVSASGTGCVVGMVGFESGIAVTSCTSRAVGAVGTMGGGGAMSAMSAMGTKARPIFPGGASSISSGASVGTVGTGSAGAAI